MFLNSLKKIQLVDEDFDDIEIAFQIYNVTCSRSSICSFALGNRSLYKLVVREEISVSLRLGLRRKQSVINALYCGIPL